MNKYPMPKVYSRIEEHIFDILYTSINGNRNIFLNQKI